MEFETIKFDLKEGVGVLKISRPKAMNALNSGADIIVIGNAIEKNPNLLIEVSNSIYDVNKSLNIH